MSDLVIPDSVRNDPIAFSFWCQWHDALVEAGRITLTDIPTFALLCRTFASLERTDPDDGDSKSAIKFVGFSNLFHKLSRSLGLIELNRKFISKDEPLDDDGDLPL